MDLHAWITQQVDAAEATARACTASDWRHVLNGIIVDRDTDGWQHAPDQATVASVAYERIYWANSPAHSPDADHIAANDPDTVLRRCEADRRILTRHRADAGQVAFPGSCAGCGLDNWELPNTEHINDCPELLDLAHAHGLSDEILAGLDRPKPPEPERRPQRLPLFTTPIADLPPAFRGDRWIAKP